MEFKLMSDNIGDISLALCKAQSGMGAAIKGKKNPFFKSSYADLSACIEAIREPFSANDLCFFQSTLPGENGNVRIITTISHKSGQWIRGIIDIKPVKTDPQATGSAISYGKRYGLQALAGLPTDDDDGERAMGRKVPNRARQTKAFPEAKLEGKNNKNQWADGMRDKYVMLCDENSMDKANQAALVGWYLEQSKVDFMTAEGSAYLVNNFADIYRDFMGRNNG